MPVYDVVGSVGAARFGLAGELIRVEVRKRVRDLVVRCLGHAASVASLALRWVGAALTVILSTINVIGYDLSPGGEQFGK